MERFVRLVVAGGLATLAGLWATELARAGTVPWVLGVVVAVGGVAALGAGIRLPLRG